MGTSPDTTEPAACTFTGCTETGVIFFADVYLDGELDCSTDLWCREHADVGRVRASGYRSVIRDPQGGRHMIREGDTVHVGPSKPGKRDGFDAVFLRAKVDAGQLAEVEVYGGKPGHEMIRTFVPERIRYRRQPKERRGAAA